MAAKRVWKLTVFDQLYGESVVEVLHLDSLDEARRAARLYEPRRCEIRRIDPDGVMVREHLKPIETVHYVHTPHIGNR